MHLIFVIQVENKFKSVHKTAENGFVHRNLEVLRIYSFVNNTDTPN